VRDRAFLLLAIQPSSPGDAERLAQALRKLRAEDPAITVQPGDEPGRITIGAMDERHLESIVDRLKREFDVHANVGPPRVRYKETLTKPAVGQMKHGRQTGGRGEYAHVLIRLSPLERGAGCHFENRLTAGELPEEFIDAAGEGMREACSRGVLEGYPMDDIRVELYDGSYHEVDSSAYAFRVAASMAFQDGAKKAAPVLLEPIMRVDVTVPIGQADDVVRNLSMRLGAIYARSNHGGMHVVRARVPLAQLFGYETDLRDRTHQRGTYTMEFDEYRPVGATGNNPDEPHSMTVGLPKRPRPGSSGAWVDEPDETPDGN
jgi:elongation factor G